MITILSIDVEEWFQAIPEFGPAQWRDRESTIEAELDAIVQRLAETGRTATFFVLGEVARAVPDAIRRLSDAGHEVASHGLDHALLQELTPAQFREQLRSEIGRLEDITGEKVRGYRAPMWSLNSATDWAVAIMVEEGLEYDSSFFSKGKRDPVEPFWLKSASGSILELPAAPAWWRGHFWALCVGVVFRNIPWRIYRSVARLLPRYFRYYQLYLHPWELSSAKRDLRGVNPIRRLYFNSGRRWSWQRFCRAVEEFAYTSIADHLEDARVMASMAVSLDELSGLDLQSFYRITRPERNVVHESEAR